MAESTPMPMYPMAGMCKGMMGRPFSDFFMIIPGIVFIVLGVLIIIEPTILVWLVAAVCVLVGIMMLVMASFIRRIGGKHTGT